MTGVVLSEQASDHPEAREQRMLRFATL